MASKRHRHKYELVPLGASNVWRCALPDCNHYMPTHMVHMVPGKASYCWGCGDDMILDLEAMKESRPRCLKCRGEDVESTPMTQELLDYIAGKQ